jgi:GNAT superfamily N-acetyltransferase
MSLQLTRAVRRLDRSLKIVHPVTIGIVYTILLMPTLSRFTNSNLPDHFAHQIRDFIRIHWFDAFQYDVHAPAVSDDWSPVYFVLAEDPALFSHAAAVTRSVECNGQTYSCGGLSAVLTYPAFRNRGYATQVVQAATEYLSSSLFDVALLWTSPENEHFYGRFGWEHRPTIRTFFGSPTSPEFYDAFVMIRWLSDRATKNEPDFEAHKVYVGPHAW